MGGDIIQFTMFPEPPVSFSYWNMLSIGVMWPDLYLKKIVILEAGNLVRRFLQEPRKEMKVVWTMVVAQQMERSGQI